MSLPPNGPPPYGPQGPYQQPGYQGYRYLEHPQGTLILVLGILSIAACQLLGPFAWWLGNNAMREIDISRQYYANRGMVQAGRVCGIVGTVLLILTLLYVIFIIAIIGAAATG